MSMDSFVFKTLNQASLSKDEAKIITLGPLATAVYPIMTSAAFLRKDSAPFFKNDYKKADFFRAGALTEEQIMQYSNLICKKDENDAIMRINLSDIFPRPKIENLPRMLLSYKKIPP